jgi:hypothetical protein
LDIDFEDINLPGLRIYILSIYIQPSEHLYQSLLIENC